MKPAIEVDRISKQFRLGGAANKTYRTLRDSVADGVRRSWGAIRRTAKSERTTTPPAEPFWALKDVSFEVQPGEVVGIIGRNGSGKSTLLKILSQIYEPTSGRARVRGRLASLLEVGTGFHPELTGRENIYLNGSILGMSRAEIKRQFDEIVAFSEIEKFLDTPVKRYSSGMYVRLAFAVAAHLNPEIMFVDEVLAVGDAEFQNKCLGKMKDVARGGRTVIFVSHNLGSVRTLCTTAIYLASGRIQSTGNVSSIVDDYLSARKQRARSSLLDRIERAGTGSIRLDKVEIETSQFGIAPQIVAGSSVTFRFHFDKPIHRLRFVWAIYDTHGRLLFDFNDSHISPTDDINSNRDSTTIECHVPAFHANPGSYTVNTALISNEIVDHVEAACAFDVTEGFVGNRPSSAFLRGIAPMEHRWNRT